MSLSSSGILQCVWLEAFTSCEAHECAHTLSLLHLPFLSLSPLLQLSLVAILKL